jgi:hypothetical protein
MGATALLALLKVRGSVWPKNANILNRCACKRPFVEKRNLLYLKKEFYPYQNPENFCFPFIRRLKLNVYNPHIIGTAIEACQWFRSSLFYL